MKERQASNGYFKKYVGKPPDSIEELSSSNWGIVVRSTGMWTTTIVRMGHPMVSAYHYDVSIVSGLIGLKSGFN